MIDVQAPLIELVDVSVRRGRDQLLSAVSFVVQAGAVHVIVGPNGAGKTTLLNALLGQIPFEGRIVAHWRGGGRVGFVPQVFAVDASLPVTVQDFLGLTRQRRPVCFGLNAATRAAVTRLLRDVGAEGLATRTLAALSGGELRRVLLAHALDPRPELLVLDEPSAGLDESGLGRLEEIVHEMKRAGVTVVIVTHDLEQVRRLADWVTVLDRRVVDDGPVSAVLTPASTRSAGWARRHAP